MPNIDLHEFITLNREDIIRRCRAKVATRSMSPPTEAEIDYGVVLFLDQLVDALRLGLRSSPQIERSAVLHGHELLLKGFTVSQVVQDYGDVCQCVTGLALEKNAAIAVEDFRTLDRCLDDAIASALTEYGAGSNRFRREGGSARASERLSFLAHQGRNLADTATLAFQMLQAGEVGVAGNTAVVLQHVLTRIRVLMDRALGDVHLPRPVLKLERFMVSEFVEELSADATLEANPKGIALTVMPVEDGLMILADRGILAAAVGNLLQNAIKFTKPQTTVTVRVGASAERVLIEVADECRGLGDANLTVRSFEELPADGSMGLGLALSRWGVEANNGRIYGRNLPEGGCVFTLDLPRLAA